MSLANGSIFNSFTKDSDITITNAAPSDVCDEFPAVTVPPFLKTGRNFESASRLEFFLGPSSTLAI